MFDIESRASQSPWLRCLGVQVGQKGSGCGLEAVVLYAVRGIGE
jgi:hypothetical protein